MCDLRNRWSPQQRTVRIWGTQRRHTQHTVPRFHRRRSWVPRHADRQQPAFRVAQLAAPVQAMRTASWLLFGLASAIGRLRRTQVLPLKVHEEPAQGLIGESDRVGQCEPRHALAFAR